MSNTLENVSSEILRGNLI